VAGLLPSGSTSRHIHLDRHVQCLSFFSSC
jgi:hypothetical protein